MKFQSAVTLFTLAFLSLPPLACMAGKGQVLVEVFESLPGKTDWPENYPEAETRFETSAFALFGLPHKYGPLGELRRYKGPILVRLSGEVYLESGSYTFLDRTNGKSRLFLNNTTLSEGEEVTASPNAHGHMRPSPDPDLPYVRGRLGTKDLFSKAQLESGNYSFTLECLIGYRKQAIPVYELLVAFKEGSDNSWRYLAPKEEDRVPLDLLNSTQLRNAQLEAFEALNREARDLAQKDIMAYWESRHKEARRYMDSLGPIASPALGINFNARNVIDQLLEAKITHHNATVGNEDDDGLFSEQVWPILKENCVSCHGNKAKGGLKLDSRAAALAGGESDYATIVPGEPDMSELMFRISTDDELDRMPSERDPLTAEQILILKQWIEGGAKWNLATKPVEIPEPLDDYSFLRRIYLDTVGLPPSPEEIKQYLNDRRKARRSQAVDRFLEDPRWADHWVSYWQDVLAENPSLMKPTLNNSGPFRYWIHESLADNKPMDQFVTELVSFQGDAYAGGAGGFRLATDNDSPMAEKAHVVGTAFLGINMKCARCHDAPYHSTTQKDLFSLAAMLNGDPVKVPDASTVPTTFFERIGGRQPLIQSNLVPGTVIDPQWPFADLIDARATSAKSFNKSSVELAWQITRPENRRFAKVMANRVWKRYFGYGFVEPAGDWEGNAASHPELLEFLAQEFTRSGYSLKHLSRLILNSAAYAREAIADTGNVPDNRFFEAPLRRRMSAEQLVDSLFQTTGVPFFTEELTLDVEGHWEPETFVNYGFPKRAWEIVSTSTERERASLSLPMVNEISTLMRVYGWRPNRAEPITDREVDANVLQPGVLANSSLVLWLTSLSNFSNLTTLALQAESPETLVDTLFLRILTRPPSAEEKSEFVALLSEGFTTRKAFEDWEFETTPWLPDVREVTWGNHLSVEANYYAAERVSEFQQGPAPTKALRTGWRERME
ncbi:MAG: DUF1553 domain-containing protein, partial [Verrucomicrobiae bacterium]|nr:DUF1553 domain-containing protein [Verrucomicrobiae bacterium]